MKSSECLSIGEMAAAFGMAAQVLRHWEDVGLRGLHNEVGGQRPSRNDRLEPGV
ncbi:MerR family transcriptional regulator [Nocardiopsis sp. NRRL B-16309]|uniref:MerR family transcriptional regulator n=1 Tax=Nocardiopsis sp. NRRL B-16309 TaxID=1519494 RepID=UPI000AA2C2D4|nr:MerR family transcriptional regulator [Nocardiopsis sp. NRRL B-16309]